MVRETHTAHSELTEVRGLNDGVRVGLVVNVRVTEIVGDDEQDIWLLFRSQCAEYGGTQREERGSHHEYARKEK